MVYNTRANSAAVVPRISRRLNVRPRSHCPVARGFGGGAAAVQCLGTSGDHRDYILAELFLRRGDQSHLTTSKATVFTWKSPQVPRSRREHGGEIPEELGGEWIPQEVELPLPCHQDSYTSFRADMVFAVGHTSLCWVDLLTGILVYNNHTAGGGGDEQEQRKFHFIPLHPKIHAAMDTSQLQQGWPEELLEFGPCGPFSKF
jgi:hypothetical protein